MANMLLITENTGSTKLCLLRDIFLTYVVYKICCSIYLHPFLKESTVFMHEIFYYASKIASTYNDEINFYFYSLSIKKVRQYSI